MKIYVVEEGDRWRHEIWRAFRTREAAEREAEINVADLLCGEVYAITEIELVDE